MDTDCFHLVEVKRGGKKPMTHEAFMKKKQLKLLLNEMRLVKTKSLPFGQLKQFKTARL